MHFNETVCFGLSAFDSVQELVMERGVHVRKKSGFFLDRRTFFHLECAGFLASFLANSFCPSFVQQANSLFHSVPVWRTLMTTHNSTNLQLSFMFRAVQCCNLLSAPLLPLNCPEPPVGQVEPKMPNWSHSLSGQLSVLARGGRSE